MIAEERWARIVNLVNDKGVITVVQLMEELGASESTIRRDLLRLDEMGRLRKVHGGATRLAHSEYVMADQSMSGRKISAHGGEACDWRLCGPADQAGGLRLHRRWHHDRMPGRRHNREGRHLLTNSLPHAQKLLAKGCRTLLPGGELKPLTEVLIGPETVDSIRRYHFTIGFWGTNGAALDSGFTTPEFNEAAVKRIGIENTLRPYVLCDSSKFSSIAPITFAEFNRAIVVTDRISDTKMRDTNNVIEVSAEQSPEQ